ncbi:MAG: hypothetical protein HY897_08865 [Deltaproteobacteria bacterium]|nr:hypothetical protein [Deltaproteobacteria bacterium]
MTSARVVRAFAVVTAAWTVVACPESSFDVAVEVCGDVLVPAQVDTLRLTVKDEKSAVISDGIIDLLKCPDGEVVQEIPVVRTFRSAGGRAAIEVQGLRKGVSVIAARAAPDTGAQKKVFLGLTEACLGITCADGQACVKGECIEVPAATDEGFCGSGPAADGGVNGDSGSKGDAGAVDAGDAGGAGDAGWCEEVPLTGR